MALYRSKSGNLVSRRVPRRLCTSVAETPIGLGLPESKPELGGAGSMDVNKLQKADLVITSFKLVLLPDALWVV